MCRKYTNNPLATAMRVCLMSSFLVILVFVHLGDTHAQEATFRAPTGEPRISTLDGRIAGNLAKPGQFPFHVGIYDAKGKQYRCGGVLIDYDRVLTSQSCLINKDGRLYKTKELAVKLGDYDIGEDGDTEHTMKLAKFRQDPNSDLALLYLSGKIPFNKLPGFGPIEPIGLPTKPSPISPEDELYFTGWGQPSVGLPMWSSLRLQRIQIGSCTIPQTDLVCSSQTSETGLCTGDVGGPLFKYVGGNPQLVGIFSGTLEGCTSCSDPSCDNYFTNVSLYLAWIYKNRLIS